MGELAIGLGALMEGRARRAHFAEIIDISPRLVVHPSGRLQLPRRPARREKALEAAHAWKLARLQKEGLSEETIATLLKNEPKAVVQGMLYWMFSGPSARAHALEAGSRLDALDAQLGARLVTRSLDEMLDWLHAGEHQGDPYFCPVEAAGYAAMSGDELSVEEEVHRRLGHLVANMALSLVAVIDHEVHPWITTDAWIGHSLVATLLAPPSSSDAPEAVMSPIALMVDLVLAAAWSVLEGGMPDRRPTASEVALCVLRHGGRARNLDRRIDSLRREHAQLTRRSLRQLVHDTKLKPSSDASVDVEARLLLPLLAAAHLLNALMPRIGHTMHHDRRGWRAAYLRWWTAHAIARGVPHEAQGRPGPPQWLTFS